MSIQVFGQGAVQSAYPSYVFIDIRTPPDGNGSTVLVWPNTYIDLPFTDSVTGIFHQVAAANIKVNTAGMNVNTITMPDATQTSIGQTIIMVNAGASAFNVLANDGITVIAIVPISDVNHANTVWFLLTDNTTSNGTWTVVTFGAGTSSSSAIDLAGNGLTAIAGKLNTNVPVIVTGAVPTINTTFRAKLVSYTGGTNTLRLPLINPVASVPAGFYFSLTNQGSGTLTVVPGEPITPGSPRISGAEQLLVQIGQSLTFIPDGTNWQTLGFGLNQLPSETVNTITVSTIIGSRTLTELEASSIIQVFQGALPSNITIYFPSDVNNWFIYNNTTNNFSLTVQLSNGAGGGTGTSFIVPQGSIQLFYSDGGSLFISNTALSLIDGTETVPAISFLSSPNTGMYYEPASPAIGFTFDGVLAGYFSKAVGTGTSVSAISTGGISTQVLTTDTEGGISFNDNLVMSMNLTGSATFPTGPLTLSTGQVLIPDGTDTAPSYSFESNLYTGLYKVSDGVLGISAKRLGSGSNIAQFFSGSPGTITSGVMSLISSGGTAFQFVSDNTVGSIGIDNIEAIHVNNIGGVSLPAAPLPIGSGGTNAITQPAAINNIMPAATVNGTLSYFDGVTWVILSPPAAGTYYLKITSGGVGTGGTPFWSLT